MNETASATDDYCRICGAYWQCEHPASQRTSVTQGQPVAVFATRHLERWVDTYLGRALYSPGAVGIAGVVPTNGPG